MYDMMPMAVPMKARGDMAPAPNARMPMAAPVAGAPMAEAENAPVMKMEANRQRAKGQGDI